MALQIAIGVHGIGPVSQVEGARSKPWIEFFVRNKVDLLGARPIAPVALFQDAPSLSFCVEAVDSQNACAAALLASNLPYEPLFSGALEDLARYRCIVLPECVCLSDDLARRFEQYVAGGGGLVVCGTTGVRDPWRRVRPESVFKQLFGDDYPRALQREVSGGRVAYLPALADAAKIEKFVRFAAGAALPFAVEAEAGSVLAAAAQARGGSLLLHLVNTGAEPARGVRCAVESGRAPRETLHDSPGRQPEPLAFHYDNGRAHFTLNEVRRYALVKIAY